MPSLTSTVTEAVRVLELGTVEHTGGVDRRAILGGAIAGSTHDYLQYVLPAIMVQTVVFSSMSIGVNLNTDITKGVFDRFRSLPIPRAAPLVGAVLGDMVRYLVSVVVLMSFGSLLGFRVQTNPLSAIAGCALVVGFALFPTGPVTLLFDGTGESPEGGLAGALPATVRDCPYATSRISLACRLRNLP